VLATRSKEKPDVSLKFEFSGFDDLAKNLEKATNAIQTDLKCPHCGRDLKLTIGDLRRAAKKKCSCGATIDIKPS